MVNVWRAWGVCGGGGKVWRGWRGCGGDGSVWSVSGEVLAIVSDEVKDIGGEEYGFLILYPCPPPHTHTHTHTFTG